MNSGRQRRRVVFCYNRFSEEKSGCVKKPPTEERLPFLPTAREIDRLPEKRVSV